MTRPEAGRTIEVDGHRTNVLVAGRGPALVLLHGSGPGVSAWSNWQHLLPDLGRDFHVVAPDVPGFGLTESPADVELGMRTWVRHLDALLEALGIDQAILVGNSFGGALSIATAMYRPQRVRGLVLLGTPAGEFPLTQALHDGWHYEPDREQMRRILGMFPKTASIVTDEMVESRYTLSARPGAQAGFRALFSEPGVVGETIVKGATARGLQSLTHPVLAVHGRDDPVVPHESALFIGANTPAADIVIFSDCGHWVQFERREEFAALLRLFAARLDRAAAVAEKVGANA